MTVCAALRLKPLSVQVVSAVAIIWLFSFFAFQYYDVVGTAPRVTSPNAPSSTNEYSRPSLPNFKPIELNAKYFLDYPLSPPYKDIFGELGQRTRLLRLWIEELEEARAKALNNGQGDDRDRDAVAILIERVTQSLFPYLKPLSSLGNSYSPPLEDIRRRLGLGPNSTSTSPTAGIVIPTGDKTLRFACHLIASLTRVHKTHLPIQIVYAGDKDLSPKGRRALQESGDGRKIEMLDILTVFDDSTLKLAEGGWAIKPFAALASQYHQVVLLDADTVFLQDPKELLQQNRFKETGVLLFHDRLLWKGGFQERQDWWHEQIKHPSKETEKSLVWTERYSEEGDSGLVVVDKTRIDVLLGLLHIGWQNSYAVREEWTYKITYGDKETWWIGFEATGSQYAFSPHYGGIVGWLKPKEELKEESDTKESDQAKRVEMAGDSLNEAREEKSENDIAGVCSFVIAHVDQTDKLLWYNGGLLKNKAVNQTVFEAPTHWMIDQEWRKGGTKQEMSCMIGTKIEPLMPQERTVLSRAIEVAKEVDQRFALVS